MSEEKKIQPTILQSFNLPTILSVILSVVAIGSMIINPFQDSARKDEKTASRDLKINAIEKKVDSNSEKVNDIDRRTIRIEEQVKQINRK